ncbi:MAG TPA: S8 family serine peptidase, partial [Streptosporangiales bacterium]
MLALLAVLLPAGGAAQAAPDGTPPAGRTPAAAGTARGATVTLVTGDKVTLGPVRDGTPTVRFRPRHGGNPGTGDGFRVVRRKDGVYVIPDDVVGLVPGVLDDALFNVTALVAMGYDDAHRKDVPLIVKRANGVRTLAATGLRQHRSLDSIGASAATVAKSDAAAFGDQLAGLQDARRGGVHTAASPLDGVRKIWLDGRMTAADLDGYLTQVNAPAAWASNLDGSGVKVAVLDTGVDTGHPDLSGQVTDAANFTDSPTAADVNGHGTHVASILAGTGAKADGARRGIAYGAHLISGKVLGDNRFGQESWVIEGMQWAVAQGAKVVNMSLGGQAGDADDPVAQALDELTASSGALFVVAAGNGGFVFDDPFSIETPGIAESALTVGATDVDDTIAWFSSEGPVRGTHRLKPDVSAPGMDILGARAGARDGDFYRSLSGTSQATPIVAGAAALLWQRHPDWDWQRVKATIVDTAARSAQYSTAWKLGGGRVDLARATTQTLTSSTASVDLGFLHYPVTRPVSKQVTLTNDGAAAETVTLTEAETRYDGAAAPTDGVTVSPATLTVPAGGSATATVTVDPSVVPDGDYQGTLTVSAGGDRPELRLPIGFYDEPEHHDLSVQVLDRNGNPYANGRIWLVDGDTGHDYFDYPLDAEGRAKLHLVPGHWAVFSTVTTPGSGGGPATVTLGGTAELDLHKDISYVLDARRAVQMRPPAVTGQPTELTEFNFTYGKRADDGVGVADYPAITSDDVESGRVFVMPSAPVTAGTFHADVRWRLEPTGRVRPGTPDSYDLLYTKPVLGPGL